MRSGDLTLRLAGDDDVGTLRVLINEAYRELAEMGLNFTGADQDDDLTRQRMRGKEVFLAYLGDSLVATVTIEEVRSADEEPYLDLNQLAVDPRHRGRGIGRMLLDLAERKALERDIPRLRLSTALPAAHLVRFYRSAGYEIVDELQRPGKTFRSVIMEKQLRRRRDYRRPR